MTIIGEIMDERHRQIEDEGWSLEHDDEHVHGELANAAATYAMTQSARLLQFDNGDTVRHRLWPWALFWWKPKNRRRDLIRAAALIIAEIERLDRREQ